MIEARNTTCSGFYRLTQPVCPGTYYTRVSSPRTREIARRLERRKRLTTEDMRTLNDARMALAGERILMARRTRFRSLDGKRHESVGHIGVEPDYEFREVKRPPGYGGPRNGNGD